MNASDRQFSIEEQEMAMTPGRHLGVSAGAGSGKTLVLTGRIVRILEQTPPERRVEALGRIVAVTFTKEAAGEIRSRIRREIYRKLRASTGAEDRTGWLALLERLPDARISTLHSLAARMLRQLALDGDIDPGFSVEEKLRDEQTAGAAPYLAELLDPERRHPETDKDAVAAARHLLARWEPPRLAKLMDALDLRRDLVESWISEDGAISATEPGVEALASFVREQQQGRLYRALTTPGPYRDWVHRLSAAFEAIITDKKRCEAKGNAKIRKAGPLLAAALGRFFGAGPGPDQNAAFGALCGLILEGGAGINVKKDWFGKETDYQQVSRLLGEIELWLPAVSKEKKKEWPESLTALKREDESPEAAVSRLEAEDRDNVRIVVRDWYRWRRRQGRGISTLDFDDLEVEFGKILRHSAAARRRIARSISHLLVDEFQDTSPVQWQFLSFIIENLDKNADVFLVGDEKQSIYAFRRADVTVFSEAVGRLGELNVSHKGCQSGEADARSTLRKSFRAQRNVLLALNRIFSIAMPDGSENPRPFEARRQPLDPVDGHTEAGGLVEWIGCPDLAGLDDRGGAEAAELRALALRLKELHSGSSGIGPVPWSKCAVICRSHAQLSKVEARLLEAGIPCHRRAEGGFFGSQEVADLGAALSVLVSPVTGAGLLAFWISPVAALPLDTIFAMSVLKNPDDRFASLDPARRFDRWMRSEGDGDLEYIASELERRSPGNAARQLRQVAGAMKAARQVLQVSGCVSALELLIGKLAVRAALGAGAGGPARLANLEKFLDWVRAREAEGLGAVQILRELNRHLEAGDAVSEPSAAWGDGDDRVALITIHGAKGLEFDVVMLPFCGTQPGGNKGRIDIRWYPAGDRKEVPAFKVPPGPGEDPLEPADFLAAGPLKDARAAAEDLRIFYVAATRARKALVFLSSAPGGPAAHLRFAFGPEADGEEETREAAFGTETCCVQLRPLSAYAAAGTAAASGRFPGIEDRFARAAAASPAVLFPAPPGGRRRVVLDYSSLRTFLDCELKYYYRHVLEVPPHRWFVVPRVSSAAETDGSPAVLGGMLRGTLLHRALELGSVGDDYLDWVRHKLSQLDESEREKALPEIVASAARALDFYGSAIRPRTEGARDVRREWEFLVRYQPPGSPDLDIDIRGAIDLAFDTGNGWEIMDYKSGRAGGEAGAREKIRSERYDLQLGLYKWALESTGRAVKTAAIAWIDEGIITPVGAVPGPGEIAAVLGRCAEDILAGRFRGVDGAGNPSNPPLPCRDCGYRLHGICREFEDA